MDRRKGPAPRTDLVIEVIRRQVVGVVHDAPSDPDAKPAQLVAFEIGTEALRQSLEEGRPDVIEWADPTSGRRTILTLDYDSASAES
jgi:hypothetical protein